VRGPIEDVKEAVATRPGGVGKSYGEQKDVGTGEKKKKRLSVHMVKAKPMA